MARMREAFRLLFQFRAHIASSGCLTGRMESQAVRTSCTGRILDKKLSAPAEWSSTNIGGLEKEMFDTAVSRGGRLSSSFQVAGGISSPLLARKGYSSRVPEPPGGVFELKLSQTGEGIAECELIRWFVEEGENVEAFQPVCEVQSDKASVEITSRYNGKIIRTHFTPGDIVKVGETLCDVLPVGVNLPPDTNHSSEIPHTSPHEGSQDMFETEAFSTRENMTHVSATPAVRHLAKSMGINLTLVEGTGKEGRVLKEDVWKVVAEKQAVEEEARMEEGVFEGREETKWLPGVLSAKAKEFGEGPEGGVSDVDHPRKIQKVDAIIPIRGYRRTMAKTMTAAKEVPHFTFMEDVEMDSLLKLRVSLKEESKTHGIELSPLSLMVKALSQALHAFPLLNSTVNCDVTEIHCKASHNIGIAMATKDGLVVPSIKHCEELSILEIAREISRLRHLASTNKLLKEDVTGGTITISNIGTIGGTYSVPLVNVPEVAIVALGRIHRLPRLDAGGNVVPVSIMQVSWSADHRVIDGASLASFCQRWKGYLERPDRLLLHLK